MQPKSSQFFPDHAVKYQGREYRGDPSDGAVFLLVIEEGYYVENRQTAALLDVRPNGRRQQHHREGLAIISEER
ncbi:hypothetical protein PZH32_12260, partial [Adlercreutzia equolifaciens]|uniref:hypothetical protein n=1 Tax=Adlercreutzia equolifaciens TaxID=446660 RepID=UPI0023B008BC